MQESKTNMDKQINGVTKPTPFTPIPAVWDKIAREEPDRIVVSIPIGNEVQDGFQDVSARIMADAINRAAWFIEGELGRSDNFQTLCYLGPSDLRYPILLSAAAKAGYKTFWTSPRNSFEGHIRLMEATECSIFLTPAVVPPGVAEIMEKLGMRHVVVPELKEWLVGTGPAKDYEFNKTYDELCHDPLTVIHTSGSTGFPKPIIIPHGFLCVAEALSHGPRDKDEVSVWQWLRDRPSRLYAPFPMFHGAGILLFHHHSQFFKQTPVLPPNKPVTPELMDEFIRTGNVNAAFLAPSLLDGTAKVPEFLENLRPLLFVIYGGAALSSEIGDKISSRTRIVNTWGQTETGILDQLWVDDKDYNYVRLGPLSNIEFQHHADDVYEAVVVRKPGIEPFQAGFIIEPGAQELRTRDLFSRHPDPAKSDLWTHCGRVDDVIVFENGEKINPVSMEGLIATHLEVLGALVVGEGRFQSALLVEPKADDLSEPEAQKSLLERLWPIIEAANHDCPAHGRVVKEMVIFSTPGKPMVRTAKGSLIRKATLALYEAEINKLYAMADVSLNYEGPALDLDASKEDFAAQMRELIVQTTAIDLSGENDDFYLLGMDSLQTLNVSRTLKSALHQSKILPKVLSPAFIYAHPTLRQLADGVWKLLQSGGAVSNGESRLGEIQDLLSEYSLNLPEKKVNLASKSIILTGSTGSLGSYLLAALYADPSIKHIYCLNRAADARSRQTTINKSRGLISSFEPSRITFLRCDFSKPDFGLERAAYDLLVDKTTHIIHNAWSVNFNVSLATLATTNIAGVRTFIDLAASSTHRAQIFFVSSIGTVMNWVGAGHQGPVPEEIIKDSAVTQPLGYAQSKYIAERLLDLAYTKSGIDACCLRVGQIAGPVGTSQGAWNQTEWFPALVTSSKALNLLPDNLEGLGHVDWIPVNTLADVVVELVNHGIRGSNSSNSSTHERTRTPIYHLVNPSTTAWSELCPVVQRCLQSAGGKEVKVVKYAEWLKALHASAAGTKTQEDFERNPAVKILDFFDGLQASSEINEATVSLSTERAKSQSKALRNCGPVTAEWMELWMKQWGF